MSLPGATVPACAISSVTVAPTHRRRGLLRQLMAGELRTAASVGFPLAALTVSESSIYGRFGFGAAVAAAEWEIDVRR
ncbi:GNAT family N-acetyltransferase, partial [Rhizobium johnstonii]